jgi:hypothetical protein
VAGGVIAAAGLLLSEARNTAPRFATDSNKMLKPLPTVATGVTNEKAPAAHGPSELDR